MKGQMKMMKRLCDGDNPVTAKNYIGTMKTGRKLESIMKRAIVVALSILVLPVTAQAKDKSTPSPHVAASGSPAPTADQILPPDILVRNVLLPAWRTCFRSEMKSWHKKGAAILERVSVTEDERQQAFAEATRTADCAEKERVALPEQDHPQDSSSL